MKRLATAVCALAVLSAIPASAQTCFGGPEITSRQRGVVMAGMSVSFEGGSPSFQAGGEVGGDGWFTGASYRHSDDDTVNADGIALTVAGQFQPSRAGSICPFAGYAHDWVGTTSSLVDGHDNQIFGGVAFGETITAGANVQLVPNINIQIVHQKSTINATFFSLGVSQTVGLLTGGVGFRIHSFSVVPSIALLFDSDQVQGSFSIQAGVGFGH